MKRLWFISCAFVFLGCDNNITEVGNPTTNHPSKVAISDGVSASVSEGITGVIGSLSTEDSGGFLSKEFKKVSDGGGFQCKMNGEAKTFTCQCPLGGTFAFTFQELPVETVGMIISFASTFTKSFTDCVVSSCEEEVRLNGTLQGSIAGSYDTSSGTSEFTMTEKTDNPCSGLKAGDVDVGLDLTFQFVGFNPEVSGTFCLDGEVLTFKGLEELRSLVDPENQCPSAFEKEMPGQDSEGGMEEETRDACQNCFDQCLADGTTDGETCLNQCKSSNLCK